LRSGRRARRHACRDLARAWYEGAPWRVPVTTSRASWDDYFMGIARQVATRSTCDRSTSARSSCAIA
jgi:deoxycytidylate deaminase